MLAAQEGHDEVIGLFDMRDTNFQNQRGDTALHDAVNCQYSKAKEDAVVRTIAALVENGANVNLPNSRGNTALHTAIEGFMHPSFDDEQFVRDKEQLVLVVQALLDNGANVNLQNHDGNTALMLAMEGYHPTQVVQILTDLTEDIDLTNNEGDTALLLACDFPQATDIILRKHAQVNFRDALGRTALHRAASSRNVDVVQLLISSNADASLQDNEDMTPLHVAATGPREHVFPVHISKDRDYELQYDLAIATILIENGVDIDLQDSKGRTALFISTI